MLEYANTAGIGLRAEHYQSILEELPIVPWLEVHSENYFAQGGLPLYYLRKIREHYPISLHGVALSLGSADPLNRQHLQQLKQLIDEIDPSLVSDHLCWNSINGQYFNELLPLPYTEEALTHIITRIQQVQDYLQRSILIENISAYIHYHHSTIPEAEFIAEAAQRSGCSILLDINNIYVNAQNLGSDARHYINTLPAALIKEIHLAGYTEQRVAGKSLLVDTHDKPVYPEVWQLYEYALQRFGVRPTLIEWDNHLPTLSGLLAEAEKANQIIAKYYD